MLNSLGQALSAMLLYGPKHPARERALDSAYDQLLGLSKTDPRPTFSFLDEEVLYRQQVIRELRGWDWGRKLSKVGIQRIEFDEDVSRDDFEGFLTDVQQQVTVGTMDTSEARQMRRPSIRFGAVNVRGTTAETATDAVATATIAYTLGDEVAAVQWVHEQVQQGTGLQLAEAEGVVRSLSLAMHSESHIILPMLQLKSFDQYTTTHATNVAVLSMALAEFIGLGPRDVREFGVAGLLHDLGKVRIPKEILTKPGAFTEEEYGIMRRHPTDGARLILEREKGLDLAAVVAYEHHIMLNGEGYPTMRYKRDCHHASKLVHVCDVYDALCTHRPYRDAWMGEAALAYLEERSGVEFEGELVTAFVSMMRQWTNQRVNMPVGVTEPAA
jgi:HD-GYP domain-containing protein (c-di-GMP phosphodiesterase class II)